jgi:hypothetical protein
MPGYPLRNHASGVRVIDMDWGIILGIIGVIGIPVAVGLTMAATTPGEFRFVRGCFIVAALLMITSALMLHSLGEFALWIRAAVAAVIGAMALGGLTVAIDWVRNKESMSVPVRNVFSQTQSIKVLPTSLGGKLELNLDNAATLRLKSPYSLNMITLMLGVPISFPDKHTADISIEGAQIIPDIGKVYTFYTGKNNNSHAVMAAGRVFIITLFKIKKLEIPNVPNPIEYEFGISEK